MTHESALVSALNTITCYVKTMEADISLLPNENEKIDVDIAGFMRSCLGMYTSIEDSQLLLHHACSLKCQEAVSHTLHHVKSLHERHVAQLPTPLLLTSRFVLCVHMRTLEEHVCDQLALEQDRDAAATSGASPKDACNHAGGDENACYWSRREYQKTENSFVK